MPSPAGSGKGWARSGYHHCDVDADDEMRRLVESYVQSHNHSPVEDFQGLTPHEMQQLLYRPFDAPEVLQFRSDLPASISAPVLDLFMQLAAFMQDGPLRLTQAGNLPVAVCTEIAGNYVTRSDIFWRDERRTQLREGDFADLHVVHIVGKLAGLLHKRHGKLNLTARARKLLTQRETAAIYLALFEAFVGKYNWGYMDGYPEFSIIQQSWAFSCFLLQREGNTERPTEQYADRFLQAFPATASEAEGSTWQTAAHVRRCYVTRVIFRFMAFLGLAEVRSEEAGIRPATSFVTRRPLLGQLLDFQVR